MLQKRIYQIQTDLGTAQTQFAETNEKLDTTNKSLTAVRIFCRPIHLLNMIVSLGLFYTRLNVYNGAILVDFQSKSVLGIDKTIFMLRVLAFTETFVYCF